MNTQLKKIAIASFLITQLHGFSAFAQVTEGPVNPDHWVASDGMGRSIIGAKEAGAKKSNKTVGMFYYIWHGNGQGGTFSPLNGFDVEKKIYANPRDPYQPNPDVQISNSNYWYFGEPELGYYRSDDPWAIRKNLQMLSSAGVDFIFLDGSNGYPYVNRAKAILEVAKNMAASGIKVPQVAWLARADNQAAIKQIYDFYRNNPVYDSLWYRYAGKPLLLLTNKNSLAATPAEIKNYFTLRFSWAFTKDITTNSDQWQWIDDYPQNTGWSGSPSNIEQIPVAKAQHAHSNIGVSYTSRNKTPTLNNLFETDRTAHGDYFEEELQHAVNVSPPIVMMTQWNESIGNCFTTAQINGVKFLGRPLGEGECGFVDIFNGEYNRDIQPVSNPKFSDNYYYQMIDYIRKYKGVSPQPDPTGIFPGFTVNGDINKWANVGPVFMDYANDAQNRNWAAAMQGVPNYVDNSARNDFISSRVMSDFNNTFFLVKTKDAISAPANDWMELWINADASAQTGFLGYDYVVSGMIRPGVRELLKYNQSSKSWTRVGEVPYAVNNNHMELSIPSRLLESPMNIDNGQGVLNTKFYFKWTDNAPLMAASKGQAPLRDFFIKGDAAPDRRFSYEYNRKYFNASITHDSSFSNGVIPFAGEQYEALRGDFDGDGKQDQAVIDKTLGQWYIKSSASGQNGVAKTPWGWRWTAMNSFSLIEGGDFDGDGIIDKAILNKSNGAIYIVGSKVGNNTYIPWAAKWQDLTGMALPSNFETLVADYDGDKISDILIVDRNAKTFNVYSSKTRKLGTPDIPANWSWSLINGNFKLLAGDYDGDGIADRVAVDKPAGKWYIISSKTKSNGTPSTPWGMAWTGMAANHIPIAGDFDGDKIMDPTIVDSNTSGIFIRPTTGVRPIAWAQRLGFPLPIDSRIKLIVGDVNGDGKDDLSAFDNTTGKYYTSGKNIGR